MAMAAWPWPEAPGPLSKLGLVRGRECSLDIWPYCVRIIPAIAEHSFLRTGNAHPHVSVAASYQGLEKLRMIC